MKIRLLGCVAALSLLGVACDQPEPDCAAARSPFAARLTLTTGDDSCRLVGPYIGDIVGVQTYTPSLGGDPAKPDLEHPFIAIKAFTLQAVYHGTASAYGVQDPEADNLDPATRTRNLYAVGNFTSQAPADELCTVPTFNNRAEYVSTEFPGTTCGGGGGGGAGGAGGGDATGGAGGCVEDPGTPGFNISYEWSNFRMIDRSDAVGNVFTAQMNYAETQTAGGADLSCSASYNVIAIAPAVDCSVYDAEGHIIDKDPALCLPEADPEAGRVAGSGLNPKLRDLIDCVDAGQAVLGYQCAIVVDTIEEVRDALENAE
jgi:hypothetical protein